MKKLLLILLVATIGCGNVCSQTKKPVRHTNSVAAKKKAEAEAKVKAEAEAKAKAEAEAAERGRIAVSNAKCNFSFTGRAFNSRQNDENYVVFEIPSMSASELKASVYTILSSMYNSPKDAITSLSDNMIQLEGFSPCLYTFDLPSAQKKAANHLIFNIIIQFKDGKVRYNSPTLKSLYIKVINGLTEETIDLSRGYKDLFEDEKERTSIENYFNNMITSINSKLQNSNDW